MGKIEALETEVREMRGQLDESRHEMDLLKKQFDTLNTDLDVRLQNPTGPKEADVFTLPDAGKDPAIELKGLSSSESANEYEQAKALLEKADYPAAEKAFSAFLDKHPNDENAGAALYWLGVTYFVAGNFEKSAAHFAKVYKNHPKSPKSPDSLLKLARSLGSLGRTTDACTTLEQLNKDFPKAFPEEVQVELKKYNCK